MQALQRRMVNTLACELFLRGLPLRCNADLKRRLGEVGPKIKSLTADISSALSDHIRLTQMCASQMSTLFGETANAEKEVRGYANRVGTNSKPRERFWCSRNEPDYGGK